MPDSHCCPLLLHHARFPLLPSIVASCQIPIVTRYCCIMPDSHCCPLLLQHARFPLLPSIVASCQIPIVTRYCCIMPDSHCCPLLLHHVLYLFILLYFQAGVHCEPGVPWGVHSAHLYLVYRLAAALHQ